ncbi:MAG TPA: TetR family transcriptional regulator [Solirubrobacteraceae bacterium]|nr:TetR family transcriptional regulator [Solirubrobacteraceae bacterium]
MIIPVSRDTSSATGHAGALAWGALDRDAKRERLLAAAARVFEREGIDAPMSAVAHAAGAGVASVYRLFASKEELLAALLARRRDQIASAAQRALRARGDRRTALRRMLVTLAESQSATDLLGEAKLRVADHPEALAARDRMTAALERLLAAAREEGCVRPDATALDLRLMLVATRAARRAEPTRWRRMLELMLDALQAPAAQGAPPQAPAPQGPSPQAPAPHGQPLQARAPGAQRRARDARPSDSLQRSSDRRERR